MVNFNYSPRLKNLVSSVFGIACYYNGEVAQSVYTASSSGYTASSVNVWGGNIPYLVSVECPFDAQSDPNYGVKTEFSEEEIKSALENTLGIRLSGNPANWLRVTGYTDGNYVSSVDIDGQTTISGRKLREEVLDYGLKSASFSVTYADGYFTFITYGYGHGVGMSQNGANILSKQGYSYIDILKHYFRGIEVY
jgi:stage II sporulation protein D